MVNAIKDMGMKNVSLEQYQKQQQQIAFDNAQAQQEKVQDATQQAPSVKEAKDTLSISSGTEKQNQLYTRNDIMNNPTAVTSLNETDKVVKVEQVQNTQQTDAMNSMKEEIAARRVSGVENFNLN